MMDWLCRLYIVHARHSRPRCFRYDDAIRVVLSRVEAGYEERRSRTYDCEMKDVSQDSIETGTHTVRFD
jgi:hypothetical protein